MNTERNCQFCKYYKDGYCENLELKPCYPSKGCEDFRMCEVDVLDKIREEVLEYIDDSDMAYEICGVFDKYKAESKEEIK